MTPVLESTLTCPECAHVATETMPMDACLFFWSCPSCGARRRTEGKENREQEADYDLDVRQYPPRGCR